MKEFEIPPFHAFADDLVALCLKYRVTLVPFDMDTLRVYALKKLDDLTTMANKLEDHT